MRDQLRESTNQQAIAAVEDWARQWSAKNVKGYLAAYAPDFEVPGGATRAAWEAERTERLERPKHIDVDVTELMLQKRDAPGFFKALKQGAGPDLHRWTHANGRITQIETR